LEVLVRNQAVVAEHLRGIKDVLEQHAAAKAEHESQSAIPYAMHESHTAAIKSHMSAIQDCVGPDVFDTRKFITGVTSQALAKMFSDLQERMSGSLAAHDVLAKAIGDQALSVAHGALEAIGDRGLAVPFRKADLGNGSTPMVHESMTKADWQAVRDGDQSAPRKAQRLMSSGWTSQNKWRPFNPASRFRSTTKL
jgi:hypothetical protein